MEVGAVGCGGAGWVVRTTRERGMGFGGLEVYVLGFGLWVFDCSKLIGGLGLWPIWLYAVGRGAWKRLNPAVWLWYTAFGRETWGRGCGGVVVGIVDG